MSNGTINLEKMKRTPKDKYNRHRGEDRKRYKPKHKRKDKWDVRFNNSDTR